MKSPLPIVNNPSSTGAIENDWSVLMVQVLERPPEHGGSVSAIVFDDSIEDFSPAEAPQEFAPADEPQESASTIEPPSLRATTVASARAFDRRTYEDSDDGFPYVDPLDGLGP